MNNTFILQSHDAERAGHHQDLYLEDGDTFLAYAIPKGIPTAKGVKHLAIKVAVHSPAEARFEGLIAEGYGKGTKEIIDEGTFTRASPSIIEFSGNTLSGRYYLRQWRNTHWLIWRA